MLDLCKRSAAQNLQIFMIRYAERFYRKTAIEVASSLLHALLPLIGHSVPNVGIADQHFIGLLQQIVSSPQTHPSLPSELASAYCSARLIAFKTCSLLNSKATIVCAIPSEITKMYT